MGIATFFSTYDIYWLTWQDRDGADALNEHYFWHMGGLLGMARGVSTAGLPPAKPSPTRHARAEVRRKRAAPRTLGLDGSGCTWMASTRRFT